MQSRQRIVFLVVALVAIILNAVLARRGWAPDPWQLLTFSLVGLVLVNIVVFIHNLLRTMKVSAQVKEEKDFEHVMEPALRGDLAQLTVDSKKIYGWIALVCMGVSAGAIVLLVLRHLKVTP